MGMGLLQLHTRIHPSPPPEASYYARPPAHPIRCIVLGAVFWVVDASLRKSLRKSQLS